MYIHEGLYNSLNDRLYKENSNINRLTVYPHTSTGKVIYSPSTKNIQDKTWVILKCDENIIAYYKWFLSKKGVKVDSLLWGSHISIIRGGVWDKISDDNLAEWKYNDEETIEFRYGDLVTNGTHWWLEVESVNLENMRNHLGLKPHPDFGFHISIGKISKFK